MTGASATADRTAGSLAAAEVRQAVARFLAAQEVADLACALLDHAPVSTVLAEIKASFRGYAGCGIICTATAKGLDVEILESTPAGMRAGVISWRLLVQVVADGATPTRLAALTTALAADDITAARDAADAIVLAGPAATQLDLLDALAALDEVPPPSRSKGRTRAARPTRSRRPAASSGGTA